VKANRDQNVCEICSLWPKSGTAKCITSRPTFKSGTARAVPLRYVPTPLSNGNVAVETGATVLHVVLTVPPAFVDMHLAHALVNFSSHLLFTKQKNTKLKHSS